MSNQQPPAPATPAPAPRSEALLPADEQDASLEVAKEVSLDLQSDNTRRVGAIPPDTPVSEPARAVAPALKRDDKAPH